jgi:hypothetical protein
VGVRKTCFYFVPGPKNSNTTDCTGGDCLTDGQVSDTIVRTIVIENRSTIELCWSALDFDLMGGRVHPQIFQNRGWTGRKQSAIDQTVRYKIKFINKYFIINKFKLFKMNSRINTICYNNYKIYSLSFMSLSKLILMFKNVKSIVDILIVSILLDIL